MTTIEPNTDLDELRNQLGSSEREALRTSKSRRKWLQSLASIHVGESIHVHISGNTAYADIAKSNDRFGITDRTYINVPAEAQSQPVTDLDDEVWDILFQKAETYHEIGHILYTDWPSFEDELHGIKSRYKNVFKAWWNILEDASIENFLAQRFDIDRDLEIKNANLLEAVNPGHKFGIVGAISAALMTYKHDTGLADDLLDDGNDERFFTSDKIRRVFENEALPIIERKAPEIIVEEDPVERNKMISNLYYALKPIIESLNTVDNSDVDEQWRGGEGNADTNKRKEGSSENVAKVMIDADHQEEIERELDASSSGDIGSGIEAEVRQTYGDELRKEKEEESDDDAILDEAENWLKIVQTNWDLNDDIELKMGTGETYAAEDPDPGRVAEARQLSNSLSKEFRRRLKQERESKQKTGQRRGRLDPQRTHKTQQGNMNVFKQEVKPDEKDYVCTLLIDRSSSMTIGLKEIEPVEMGVAALAFALEDVGISVQVLSFGGMGISLEKAFGASVESAKDNLFNKVSSGGTPMTNALELSKERMKMENGKPFVIAVADGEPDHREAYRDELHDCNFPVMGLYVDAEEPTEDEKLNEVTYFHSLVTERMDNTYEGVRRLTKQVMF